MNRSKNAVENGGVSSCCDYSIINPTIWGVVKTPCFGRAFCILRGKAVGEKFGSVNLQEHLPDR